MVYRRIAGVFGHRQICGPWADLTRPQAGMPLNSPARWRLPREIPSVGALPASGARLGWRMALPPTLRLSAEREAGVRKRVEVSRSTLRSRLCNFLKIRCQIFHQSVAIIVEIVLSASTSAANQRWVFGKVFIRDGEKSR